jgi:hypothetical protein
MCPFTVTAALASTRWSQACLSFVITGLAPVISIAQALPS